MRRRFASLPLASIMMLASVAGAAPWFDAGIADYAVWPQTVTSWYVPCVGTWQGTADAELFELMYERSFVVANRTLSPLFAGCHVFCLQFLTDGNAWQQY